MAWNVATPHTSIAVYTSGIELNVDNVESDLRLVFSDTQLILSDSRLLLQEVRPISGTFLDVAIAAATTDQIGIISDFRNAAILHVEIDNSDVVALDKFVIAFRAHSDSAFQYVASDASAFTTVAYPLLGCSEDLASLLADGNATFSMDILGMNAVKLSASGDAASTAVTARWQAR